MKKTIVKPLQQQTKSLFKFKNSGIQTSKFSGINAMPTTLDGDPTVATTTIVTW